MFVNIFKEFLFFDLNRPHVRVSHTYSPWASHNLQLLRTMGRGLGGVDKKLSYIMSIWFIKMPTKNTWNRLAILYHMTKYGLARQFVNIIIYLKRCNAVKFYTLCIYTCILILCIYVRYLHVPRSVKGKDLGCSL